MTVMPTDDAGARTAAKYEWQALMAAADGLRMYLDALDTDGNLVQTEVCRVLCERHEDWVALRNGDAELVSAKDFGLSFGAYTTLNSLADDGGVAHLFNRWLAMQEKASCRLVTTVGLEGPPQKLVALAEALRDRRLAGRELVSDEEHDGLLNDFGKALLKYCGGLPDRWKPPEGAPLEVIPTAEHRRQMARFLSVFSFQSRVPEDYVGHAAPSMYVQPVLDRLRSPVAAGSVWEAVASLFRARMRAAGPISTGGLPKVLAFPLGASTPTPVELEGSLASRIVTLQDIDLAIRTAIAYPAGFAQLPRLVRTSRLAVKMETGGCSDNAVERAEQLRTDYQDLWRQRLAADPVARIHQSRLHRMLLKISDTATFRVRRQTTRWGADLWRQLETELEQHEGALPDDMDIDLALGGLCELSNRCQVWFSDSFDVDQELARRRGSVGGEDS
ncbi:hypothetical protein ACFFX1_34195 [Dactylosporangium sucinum]|nr:hypothetical protein [Dactylosporangium sucinum]